MLPENTLLTRLSAGSWLYLAIAIVSAAIADPIVEFLSNSGRFGPGSLTDHSSLDVVPSILLGLGLLALYIVRRAHALLAGRALPRRVASLLPQIFVLQMIALYAMETLEQIAAYGHPLGPLVWLGGPLPVSVALHAVTCLAVTLAIARSGRRLAATTLRVIRFVRALATLAAQPAAAIVASAFESICHRPYWPVLSAVGERAPPITAG